MSLEQGYQILGRDRTRLAGTNYPVYRGPLSAPKSVLTQKAEDLTNRYSGRPLPYSGKLQTILGRGNEALSQQEITDYLNSLNANQGQFRNSLLNTLQGQFKSSYTPRANDFTARTDADIQRGLGEAAGNINNINMAAGTLEGNRNRKAAESLQNLQGQKLDRRNAYIEMLNRFGNQEQGHGNLVNQANRNQFNRSVDEQQLKLGRLAQVLEKTGGNLERGALHPDLEAADRAEIEQAIKAYNQPQSNYPGQLVAPLPNEIRGVNDVLARMNPTLRDSYSGARKNAVANFANNQTVASRALNSLPNAIGGELSQLEEDARNTYEKNLEAINNKYIRMGQYNSPAHLREAEERAKELNKIVSQHRNRLNESGLNNQLRLQHEGEIGNINTLNLQGDQGQREVANLFNNFKSINQLGADKWKSKQAENEEQYKNFQSQLNWEWPQARGLGIGGGNSLGNVAPIVPGNQADIGINNLSNLNTAYNSISAPPIVPMPTTNNMAQAQGAIQPAINQAAQNVPPVPAPQMAAPMPAATPIPPAAAPVNQGNLNAYNAARQRYEELNNIRNNTPAWLGFTTNQEIDQARGAMEAAYNVLNTPPAVTRVANPTIGSTPSSAAPATINRGNPAARRPVTPAAPPPGLFNISSANARAALAARRAARGY